MSMSYNRPPEKEYPWGKNENYEKELAAYKRENRLNASFALTMLTVLLVIAAVLLFGGIYTLVSSFGFFKIGSVILFFVGVYLFFYQRLGEE